jgi:hypothetical protein
MSKPGFELSNAVARYLIFGRFSRLTGEQRLVVVRGVHTAIYAVMAVAVLALLYAGLSGAKGAWLWPAVALVLVESAVFVAGGLRCPFTALAAMYTSEGRTVSDTFFPERITRYTLTVFGPLVLLGLALLAARWWNVLG